MTTRAPRIKRLVRALWRGLAAQEFGMRWFNEPMYAMVDGKPFWFPGYRGH